MVCLGKIAKLLHILQIWYVRSSAKKITIINNLECKGSQGDPRELLHKISFINHSHTAEVNEILDKSQTKILAVHINAKIVHYTFLITGKNLIQLNIGQLCQVFPGIQYLNAHWCISSSNLCKASPKAFRALKSQNFKEYNSFMEWRNGECTCSQCALLHI